MEMAELVGRRLIQLVRQIAGVPRLEAAVRQRLAVAAEAPVASVVVDSPAVLRCLQLLEERNRTLVALGLPMVVSAGVSQENVLHFCRQFAPYEVKGFSKVRLGNQHDGGYIFIDDFAKISTVISCGISNDVTCDFALAEMGKPILQFDHTVEGPPESHPLFDFRKQAIDALGSIPGSVKLWDVTKALGDSTTSDVLLKIDIDGDEWATFANYPVDDLKRFRQISCEFHWSSRMKDPEYFSVCLRAIENLRKVFFPAHLHANNFVNFVNLMGVPIPEVYEVTFVNSSHYLSLIHI